MKKLVFITIAVSLCTGLTCLGQKAGRYHKNLLYEADIYFQQGDYYYAAELYEELLLITPQDPVIQGRLGISYYFLPPLKDKSLDMLEKAVELGDTEALFYLAKLRHEEYRFYDALDLLSQYERRIERKQSEPALVKAKSSAMRATDFVKTPLQVNIQNLGAGVNTPMHDYAPVWDMANNRLYLTSRRRYDDRSEKDFSEQFDENIYVVDLNAKPLLAQPAQGLNTRTNDAAVACTRDGRELIVYRTSKDGFSGNLYIAPANEQGWGKMEKLSDKINSKHQEASASFGGPEENVLYFSSDRPGGFGGKDIYKVQRLPDGNWSEPMNLGASINTEFDEDAPFVAADGTLYFASKGHDNMGGFDIFSALPSAGGYAAPTNMGYPINTPADDIFFSIDAEGKTGYFSSDRKGGHGMQDLYSVTFDDSGVIFYRGQLVGINNQVESRATIRLIEDERGVETVLYQTEIHASDFVLALEPGKEYTMVIEAAGYKKFSRTFQGAELNKANHFIEEQITLRK